MADPKPVRILCVGTGNMGSSHAKAYKKLPGFEIVGLVSRTPESRGALNTLLGSGIPEFSDYREAIAATKPDAVSICTYPDTHSEICQAALDANAHIFVEKPLAASVADAEAIVARARELKRKVVVGYILRHHPTWTRFIEVARTLGTPLVMRMNLNQQSCEPSWRIHKELMRSCSPIVDCGIHYVDIMSQMTLSPPVRVSGIGARLSDELLPGMVNYGQLQVTFANGSVGWYEAGWGPMMSEEAFFIKDVVGPKGSVTIVAGKSAEAGHSSDLESHTGAQALRLHHSALGPDGKFAKKDEILPTEGDPGHDGLCEREQVYFERAIREDLDLNDHLEDALNSMRIVDAADRSFREGRTIEL
ncbi:putative Myo-inositol 2-dehydrogenase [Hyaloraphidium curvatum]|nr:putative Myo-inositol 2-dehydrogenase [Hyaloraphidium curvatum]